MCNSVVSVMKQTKRETANKIQGPSKRLRPTVCSPYDILLNFTDIQEVTQCSGFQRQSQAYDNALGLCDECQKTLLGLRESHALEADAGQAQTRKCARQETVAVIN